MNNLRKYKIPFKLIELEKGNFHILVESHFHNGHTGMWVIDTGASKSVFDIKLDALYEPCEKSNIEMQSAGIGEGQIETACGVIKKMFLGDAPLRDFELALIDLSHINYLYERYTNEVIRGLIGSDFLVNYNAKINFNKLELTIYC